MIFSTILVRLNSEQYIVRKYPALLAEETYRELKLTIRVEISITGILEVLQ